MKLFNVIKPDMVEDIESLTYYFEYLKNNFNVKECNMYSLKSWVSLSKKLYFFDSNKDLTKKKQILTTIFGYYLLYNDESAVVNLYDVENINQEKLRQLYDLKKQLRKRYVLNTDKYYIRILNEDNIDYTEPLEMLQLETLDYEIVKVPFNREYDVNGFRMAFFNKLHFPDPYFDVVNKELSLLTSENVFEQKNRKTYVKF